MIAIIGILCDDKKKTLPRKNKNAEKLQLELFKIIIS